MWLIWFPTVLVVLRDVIQNLSHGTACSLAFETPDIGPIPTPLLYSAVVMETVYVAHLSYLQHDALVRGWEVVPLLLLLMCVCCRVQLLTATPQAVGFQVVKAEWNMMRRILAARFRGWLLTWLRCPPRFPCNTSRITSIVTRQRASQGQQATSAAMCIQTMIFKQGQVLELKDCTRGWRTAPCCMTW